MNKTTYILGGVFALLFTASLVCCGILYRNGQKVAVDKYKIEQLHAQDVILKHESDSLMTHLLKQNIHLVSISETLVHQRDSLIAASAIQISHIQTSYHDKISHLSQLHADSLHLLFARQLSASGSH